MGEERPPPMEKYSGNDSNKEIECNLLNQIQRPEKLANNVNIHYYPILQGCMNTVGGIEKVKNLRILLDSGFSPTIIMVNMMLKVRPKKYHVT